MTNRKWRGSLDAKARSVLGYGALMARNLGGSFPTRDERTLDKSLRGYPRNHNYRLCRGGMLPSFRLYERLRAVTALYPQAMESFLDLGCCRGYFVLEAAGRPGCRTATGIDVYEPFVSISNRVRRHLDVPAARFYLAGLEDVARKPESYGGPFNVVLLLGTYHYLYWGSRLCPSAYHDHREILSRLFRVCAGRLIFSARLEVDRLPDALKADARANGKASDYSEARFLDAAEKFFDVRQAGRLGKDSLLLLLKKGAAFSGATLA